MGQEPLKDGLLSVRIDGALKQRIARAFSLYGVTEATLVRDSVEAALNYIEQQKGYRRPIQMTLDTVAYALAAESPATYEHGPVKAKPPKPPDQAKRTRGGGPAHRVSLSA